MKKPARLCAACSAHQRLRRQRLVTCRECGREVCYHFAACVTDDRSTGTCSGCRIARGPGRAGAAAQALDAAQGGE